MRLKTKKYTHILLYTGAFSPLTIAHCLSIVSSVYHLISKNISVNEILVIISPVGQAYGKNSVNKYNIGDDKIINKTIVISERCQMIEKTINYFNTLLTIDTLQLNLTTKDNSINYIIDTTEIFISSLASKEIRSTKEWLDHYYIPSITLAEIYQDITNKTSVISKYMLWGDDNIKSMVTGWGFGLLKYFNFIVIQRELEKIEVDRLIFSLTKEIDKSKTIINNFLKEKVYSKLCYQKIVLTVEI